MDIEQLKLVLETVQTTTDGAKNFGVWWIALHYGEKILSGLLVVICVWGVLWGIVKAIMIGNEMHKNEARLRHLRDTLRIGSSGFFTDSEYEQMKDKIKDLMKGESK